jgi:hypothetical protein
MNYEGERGRRLAVIIRIPLSIDGMALVHHAVLSLRAAWRLVTKPLKIDLDLLQDLAPGIPAGGQTREFIPYPYRSKRYASSRTVSVNLVGSFSPRERLERSLQTREGAHYQGQFLALNQ